MLSTLAMLSNHVMLSTFATEGPLLAYGVPLLADITISVEDPGQFIQRLATGIFVGAVITFIYIQAKWLRNVLLSSVVIFAGLYVFNATHEDGNNSIEIIVDLVESLFSGLFVNLDFVLGSIVGVTIVAYAISRYSNRRS